MNLNASHVIFTMRNIQGGFIHGFKLEGVERKAIVLDLERFLTELKKGVAKWHDDNGSETSVVLRINSILSMRLNGIEPLMTGYPVLASGPD